MILRHLSLARVRAFEQAEFDFQPGMNLLVGVNGAGKSTILDTLCVLYSYLLPKITRSEDQPIAFNDSDIQLHRDSLEAHLSLMVSNVPFDFQIEKRQGRSRTENIKPDNPNILAPLQRQLNQPIVAYFSIRRSHPIDRDPGEKSSAGDQRSAFADALRHRELNVREFADWWLVQEALGKEAPNGPYGRRLRVLNDAVTSFLDDCHDLRAVREPQTTLVLDKGRKMLDVRMLSDGERSMIALVLDLARRLTLANPKLDDPLREGRGVVLIDEIDLHLHPRWQRTIVDKLTRTFPNCQFIATTHSPQIVGEISPDNIILIENGKATRPDQSLGMDTNWILRHLMGVSERDEETKRKLENIEALIEDEQYDAATQKIDDLRRRLGDFPELVGLQTRIDMIQFLSDAEDE